MGAEIAPRYSMPATKTIDLRGAAATPGAQGATVLADPTGRRGRRMRIAGRLVAAALTLWLCGLALAGIGLLPAGSVPLAQRIDAAPPALSREDPLVARPGAPPALARPASGAARDLPGGPDGHRTTGSVPDHSRSRAPKRAALRKGPASGALPAAPATPHAGKPPTATAPGAATATPAHGNSGTAPGHSGTAPGQTRTPPGRATPTPTPAGTPAPTPTPKPHGQSGANGGRDR